MRRGSEIKSPAQKSDVEIPGDGLQTGFYETEIKSLGIKPDGSECLTNIMLLMHYYNMREDKTFWNRQGELAQIRKRAGSGAFGYVTGRRRVGKTATLLRAAELLGGIYHQAVEGTPQQQLLHFAEEIGNRLPIFQDIVPKSWEEFFRLLSREKLPGLVVFDEFPYWVQGDPRLPSLLQKWIDHDLAKSKSLLLVSGSSQSMLHSQFLRPGAPLYGRALFHLHLEPMDYQWFCRALGYPSGNPLSFTRFSLVGGIPHYWKLTPKASVVKQAEELYFRPAAILADEPTQWVREEGVIGSLPKAILDLVGRGVHRPSEIASRLATVQGNLSRPLALLLQLGLIQREFPYGESPRSSKKVLYRIKDPALSFYYGTYLPQRLRWQTLQDKVKIQLLESHASTQWEHFWRDAYPGSGRYWEGKIEIDLVSPLPGGKGHLVAECKWAWLSKEEEKSILDDLQRRFSQTRLAGKLRNVHFKVFSKGSLNQKTEHIP